MSLHYLHFYNPKQEYGWASNFYPTKPLVINGEKWLTSEAYFQAMKFRGPNTTPRSIEYSNIIKKADKPKKAVMLGTHKKNSKKWQLASKKDTRLVNHLIDEYKDLKVRPDWNIVQINVMIKAILTKFKDPNLCSKMLSIPDNTVLVNRSDDDGKNYLGKILTAVRWTLKYGDCSNMPKKLKKAIRIKKKAKAKATATAKAVCVKVANLRKIGYFSIREWIADPKNLYVGRRGRVWITEKNGDKTIYHYPQSKWHNPFKVSKDMPLEKSIRKYREHIMASGLIDQIRELDGLNLGCFCTQDHPCHAQILAELVNKE